MIGRLIGLASLLLGLFALYIAPVSTVSCSKSGDNIECRASQAMLGIVPLHVVNADHVIRAEVTRGEPGSDVTRQYTLAAQPNATYQLAFLTPAGRIAPRGLDAADPSLLNGIVQEVSDLKSGDGGPFTERSYNTFPIVAGLIFAVIGLLALISGS